MVTNILTSTKDLIQFFVLVLLLYSVRPLAGLAKILFNEEYYI